MDDNAEEGIARVQTAATRTRGSDGDGLRKRQGWGIAYLDERIAVFVVALAIVGLVMIWTTASSPLLLYGSLAGVIALTVLWGVLRIRRVETLRREREREARDWRSANSE